MKAALSHTLRQRLTVGWDFTGGRRARGTSVTVLAKTERDGEIGKGN